MKKLNHKYVDITGVVINKITYYAVSIVEEYDLFVFGKFIKKISTINELPFVFKELEVAKDFCELNPKITQYTYSDRTRGDYYTKYKTYELLLNNKIYAYVIWEDGSMLYESIGDSKIVKPIEAYPVVRGFITDINNNLRLPTYWDMNYMNAIKRIDNLKDKLSDIFYIDDKEKYHFELVEK